MRLGQAFSAVSTRLDRLDFSALWPGFHRFDFALYDDDTVLTQRGAQKRTPEFLANTAIEHEGRLTAIWQLSGGEDSDVLAAKLAHEMFHAFQRESGERRFAREMEALEKYRLNALNLTVRQEERGILARLCERFGGDDWARLGGLRAFRRKAFPYEFDYEARVEQIEGTAQYVEQRALEAIAPGKTAAARKGLCGRMRDMRRLIPVRIDCYDTGELLVLTARDNGRPFETDFSADCIAGQLCGEKAAEPPAVDPEISRMLGEDEKRLAARVRAVTEHPGRVIEGDFGLLGVNVYSARRWNDFVLSDCFVQYSDGGETRTEKGNFAIHLCGNGRVDRIFAEK